MHIYYVMFAIKSMVRAYFVFCLSRRITLIESIFNEKELHVLNELIFQRDTNCTCETTDWCTGNL